MGFGTLFVGYLIAFFLSLTLYGGFFSLVGYGFMMAGLRELRQYHRPFLYSLIPLPFMMLGALWRALSSVASYLPGGLSGFFSNASVTSFVKYAEFCLIFVFHMALFFGIYGIAKKIGLPKITSSTVFSTFAYCLYFVLYAVSLLPFEGIEAYKRVMGAPIILLQLFWVVLNAVLLWQCYVHICKEGDEDVPLRVSRFGFVNKIRQELERKEQKGIEETIEHAKRNQKEYLEGKAKIDAMKKERMARKKGKK